MPSPDEPNGGTSTRFGTRTVCTFATVPLTHWGPHVPNHP